MIVGVLRGGEETKKFEAIGGTTFGVKGDEVIMTRNGPQLAVWIPIRDIEEFVEWYTRIPVET